MMKKSLGLASLLAVAACAGPAASGPPVVEGAAARPAAPRTMTKEEQQAARLRSEWTCTYERPTGSNIPEKVCRLKSDAERNRDQVLDALRTAPSINMRPGG